VKWIDRIREWPLVKRFHWLGLAGSFVLIACVLLPMVAYAGGAGERYSPLNHYISELGEVGVSPLAMVFNAGLVAAGVLYLPFVLGFGVSIGGWWAAAGTAAGIVSAVSVACVGLFPMNNLAAHETAAMTFFRSGLATVLLCGVAIQRQQPGRRVIDRRANIAGAAAVIAYAAFLARMQVRPGSRGGFPPGLLPSHPAVRAGAVLEWSILVTMVVWFFVVAACRTGLTPPSRSPRPRSSHGPGCS
jgi:hypothetical membrane protein